jgi:cytochrome c oxidase subunit 2
MMPATWQHIYTHWSEQGTVNSVFPLVFYRLLITVHCSLILTACTGIQSALEPHGPHAEKIAEMGWLMFAGAAVIFGAVIALTAYALFARQRAWMNHSFIVAAGIVFPVAVLSVLLIYTFTATRVMVTAAKSSPLKIEVIGEQWWWRVRYLDDNVVTANEIHIPTGLPIEFTLKSADVIHSFWVPNLAGKLDMIPGQANTFQLQADHAGIFRGQCAEYCGGPHAKMAFYVIAEAPEDFARWLANERAVAREPETTFLAHGKKLFLDGACASCHAIRGTAASGQLGPDLTHVGARVSIGAGILPNNAGTLAGWIASSQHLKPENRMPSFNIFTGQELRALAGYLESLK